MKKNYCIAIIPARGGSKRIKIKNIKNFCGKPIIAYSIQTAKESNLFDRIIVSTDSKKIAKIALRYGAEVPFLRPKKLANDYANMLDVMAHATKLIEKKYDRKIRAVCCIFAISPFMQIKDLFKAWKLFKTGKWRSVISATAYSFPVYRSFKKIKTGGLKMLYPNYFKKRSQDLSTVMHDAGQFCWSKPKDWINKKLNFNSQTTAVELPSWRVQDIDTLDDWKNAELKFKLLKNI